jgi:hypothetical protein
MQMVLSILDPQLEAAPKFSQFPGEILGNLKSTPLATPTHTDDSKFAQNSVSSSDPLFTPKTKNPM